MGVKSLFGISLSIEVKFYVVLLNLNIVLLHNLYISTHMSINLYIFWHP